MQRINKIKEEKGSITVYVAAMLFGFLIILASIYAVSLTARKAQLVAAMKIKESYEHFSDDETAEKIYLKLTE